jgi:hypothetical protein
VQKNDIRMAYHLAIGQITLFGCCDFIAQCILVRTSDNAYPQFIHLIFNLKDISLLDCVELQYLRCDHSHDLRIRLLRSVNLFDSLTDLNLTAHISYVDNGYRCT